MNETYKIFRRWLFVIGITALASITWHSAEAKLDSYPRLANYYLTGGGINDEEARLLAKWDVVILGLEVPEDSPRAFNLIKQLNSDIKLLSYIDSISRRADPPSYPLGHPIRDCYEGGKSDWILRSGSGKTMSVWPGSILMNPSTDATQVSGKRWNDYIPEFITRVQEKQGVWDGIFFDNAMVDIAWLNDGKIDINGDGKDDSPEFIDDAWREGLRTLYRNTRTLNGASKIIVTNSSNIYSESTNGRMFETVLTDSAKWARHINAIRDAVKQIGYQPAYVVVNANTNNDGDRTDWKRFRFAFTTTLLTDAYFSFDYGDKWHQQLWWYDEYDADLSLPRGDAHVLDNGVWRRNFDRGIVLVNPTAQTINVAFDGEYQRLNGTQDRSVNNGMKAASVTLPAYDGIVLKSLASPVRTDAMNRAPTVMVETAVWSKGKLTLYRNGIVQWSMLPYDNRWRGNVSMAVGDVDDDGVSEIVLAAGPGGGPHIRIIGRDGKLRGPGFFAYVKKRRTGAAITLVDRDGNGIKEILVSSGRGEMREVKVFDYRGNFLESLDAAVHYRPFSAVENLNL